MTRQKPDNRRTEMMIDEMVDELESLLNLIAEGNASGAEIDRAEELAIILKEDYGIE